MTRGFVWLSRGYALIVCHSLANACHLGNDGDRVFQFCSECEACIAGKRCNRMSGKPSHLIVISRNGKKRAVRLRH